MQCRCWERLHYTLPWTGAVGNHEVKEAYRASLWAVRTLLGRRYEQFDLKGTQGNAHQAASDDEMLDMTSSCAGLKLGPQAGRTKHNNP